MAIVAVVLFHSGFGRAAGGFVGVDMFLVLSGWLITRQLVAPVLQGRPPRLADFWARRIRRLIPAMAVMVGVSLAAAFLVLSPLEWGGVAEHGAASMLYGANILFAFKSANYFGNTLENSPFLHTWSLGLEEQFYLIWPLLFWAVARTTGNLRPRNRREWTLAMLVVVVLLSFVVNLAMVDAQPVWAFYLLPSRAWEFAVGGLAAALWPELMERRSKLWAALPFVGLVIIVWSVMRYDSSVAFPGTAAVVPVLGTLLIICGSQVRVGANAASGPMTVALSWRPVRWLGLVSYSWYLWHWPFVVLLSSFFLTTSPWANLVYCLLALPVAALSLSRIERPAKDLALFQRPGRAILIGGGVSMALVLVAVGLYGWANHQLQQEPYKTYERVNNGYENQACQKAKDSAGLSYCTAGDPHAKVTVALVGDSHALHWISAMSKAARDQDVRLVVRWEAACSAAPGEGTPSCVRFQRDTQDFLDRLNPQVVIFSDARDFRSRSFASPEKWATSYAKMVEDQRAEGRTVGHVIDMPETGSPMLCVARGNSSTRCAPRTKASMALTNRYRALEARVFETVGNDAVLSAGSDVCGPERCPLKSPDGVWVFAARTHLAKDYTLSRSGDIERFLVQLLG